MFEPRTLDEIFMAMRTGAKVKINPKVLVESSHPHLVPKSGEIIGVEIEATSDKSRRNYFIRILGHGGELILSFRDTTPLGHKAL